MTKERIQGPSPLPASMADHWWWRPGVRPGRQMLVWHILFDDQPPVRALAREHRERLSGIPGLDPVPEQWLHMTTQVVGFKDEIPGTEQSRMIEEAAHRLDALPPVTAELGEILGHSEAVVLGLQPQTALDDLRTAIRASIAATVSTHHLTSTPHWHPHLSVAYSNTTAPSSPIVRALTPPPPPATLTITRVHLVSQLREGHTYRWEPLASVPLGAER